MQIFYKEENPHMKKFLSLVLALVMTMSLVTVSAGAKEFKDDDKITYDEAVAVISAIGVVDGYSDGSFKPTDTLTRGAAAKIICNLILGPTTASALSADTAPFIDVPVSNNFAGYITYCSQQGIISGYSDGTFRPGNSLTGYAFMKMLLGALGYDAKIENYVGPNWTVNVAKQALGIDLDDGYSGEFNGTKAVTREEACLYAFNTLEATMVEYDAKTSVNVSGIEVQVGGSEAKKKEQPAGVKSYTGDKDDDTLQFCEEYFEDLKKDETNDDFGRPANTWKIKSAEIGTWVDKSDLEETWTAKVTKEALYAAVGKTVVDDLEDGDADLTYWVDGYKTSVNRKNISDFMAKNNTAKINGDASDTGKGVLTEVYVDDDNNTTVVVIRTYVFQATEDYNSSKNKVRVAAAGDTDELNITLDDYDLDGDDFDISGVEEDDYLLITCTKGVGDSKYEVQTVEKAELVTGEIDAYSDGDDVTVEGETYEYACTADETVSDEIQSTGGTTSLVLDKYGYIIAVDDTVVSGNYVFIAETEKKLGSAVNAYAYFADGTSGEIALKKVAGSTSTQSLQAAAGWYTYSEDSSGKYTLSRVSGSYSQALNMKMTATGKVLVNGNANLYTIGTKSVKANEKTVFVVVDDDGDVDIYTGISKAPDVTVNSLAGKSGYPMGYVYKDSNGFASYVFISVEDLNANVDATSEDDVYVFLTKSDSKKDNGTDTYEVFKALVDGDETKISVDDLDSYDIMKLYTKVKTDNTTERITDMKEVDVAEADSTYAKIYFEDATVSFKDGVLSIDTDGKLFDKDGNAFLTDKVTYIVNGDSQLNLILNYSRGSEANKDKDVQDMMTKDGEGHEARGNISGSSLKSTLAGYTVSGYFYAITEDDYIVGSKIDNTTLDYLFLCVNEATPTRGNGNGSGSGSDGDVDYTTKVTSSGIASVSLTYDRPSYIPASASVELTFDVYADGAFVEESTATVPSKGSSGTSRLGNVYDTDEEITIKITKIEPSAVNVKYVDENGKDITGKLSSYTKTLSTTDAESIKFLVDTNDSSNLSLTIAGTTNDLTTKTEFQANQEKTCAARKADGKTAVTVTIYGLDTLNNDLYTVTGISGQKLGVNDKDGKEITLTVNASRTVVDKNDNSVKLTVTTSAAIPATEAAGLKITLSTGDVFYVPNDGSTTNIGSKTIKVTEDTEITAAVADLKAPVVTAVAISDEDGTGTITKDDVITITFSEAVTYTDNNWKVSDDGMTATRTITDSDIAEGVLSNVTIKDFTSVATGVKNIKTTTISSGTTPSSATFQEA